MVDDKGKLFLIDFGFSKRMNAATYKKYGAHPNISLSLCWFVKMLRRHDIGAPLCQARMDAKRPCNPLTKKEVGRRGGLKQSQ